MAFKNSKKPASIFDVVKVATQAKKAGILATSSKNKYEADLMNKSKERKSIRWNTNVRRLLRLHTNFETEPNE